MMDEGLSLMAIQPGLSADPLSNNRYALAGGNPLAFIGWDGHYVTRDGDQVDLAASRLVPGTGGGQIAPDAKPSRGRASWSASRSAGLRQHCPTWQQT
jgi:hypothetical protein